MFDARLNFKDHIQEKINKVYNMIGLLKRNFIHVDGILSFYYIQETQLMLTTASTRLAVSRGFRFKLQSFDRWLIILSFVYENNTNFNDVCINVCLYADDAKIYRSITCVEDSQCLKRVVDKVEQWCDEWLLPLNVSKCNAIIYF